MCEEGPGKLGPGPETQLKGKLGAITLIGDVFGESERTLRSRSRRPGRKALALIGALDCGLPHAPIAEWLDCTDWAVSKLIRTAQELQRSDRRFERELKPCVCNCLRLLRPCIKLSFQT